MATKTLYLCAGPQSSGSTLISWCFLQRRDMDGILDANNDELSDLTRAGAAPFVWVKTTISSFRLSEQIAHYQDLGWDVRPLLICRDVREVYASLRTKEYGRNGTTAEDPPLRLRLRRFREDWDLFHDNDWPILRYDEFLKEPEPTLRTLCVKLHLPWDAAMLSWPKPRAAILDTRHGNETFRRNCGSDLPTSLQPAQRKQTPIERLRIPAVELDWLEHEFARFNHVNSYPAHVEIAPMSAAEDERAIPRYQVARRCKWKLHQTPVKYLLARVARWFEAEATPTANIAPAAALPRPRTIPVGDDSCTDLGELAAAGS
jgi:hypothetical protein